MEKILSNLSISSMSSSDSYQSLTELDKPNAIECPICLDICDDDTKQKKKEKNKVFKCKHAVCRDCYNQLKKTSPYKCPVCRKVYGNTYYTGYHLDVTHLIGFSLSGLSV